ncbi:MAG: thiol:disulfide interchange protein [Gallionellales bacterium GWA2_60_18]|nr:MAG: thiol:disulfide interchange protein [Gallionellales bacterium GWA2_60_18]
MQKLFASLLMFAALSAAHAGEEQIRQSLLGNFPNLTGIDRITKTPYGGLYEVVIADELLYTDEQGKYLFKGSVIEVKSRDNLTEQRHRELFAIDFDKLPLNLAVKRVKGNGKRKMVIFEDPRCGYCKRLAKELTKVSDVTVYHFLYPIFDGSEALVNNTLCAGDPLKAWDNLMLNGVNPPARSCKTNTAKVMALGNKMRISGTPNLIFADGTQVPGYLPAEELEKLLDKTSGK